MTDATYNFKSKRSKKDQVKLRVSPTDVVDITKASKSYSKKCVNSKSVSKEAKVELKNSSLKNNCKVNFVLDYKEESDFDTKLIAPNDFEHIYKRPKEQVKTKVWITASDQQGEPSINEFAYTLFLKRPKAVLFDFGQVVRESFVPMYLLPSFKDSFQDFCSKNWSNDKLVSDLKGLLATSKADKKAPQIIVSGSMFKQIESIVEYVKYCEENKLFSSSFNSFRFHVWEALYSAGILVTPVKSKLVHVLRMWHKSGIQLFTFTNNWADATKMFMTHTSEGNLEQLVQRHFDKQILGQLTNAKTFDKLISEIKMKMEDVYIITSIPNAAKQAKKSAITAILIGDEDKYSEFGKFVVESMLNIGFHLVVTSHLY